MKVKLGTSLDKELLARLQAAAHRKGQRLNEALEVAIRQYLIAEPLDDDIVARTWGTFKIDRRTLDRLMNEDIHEA